jgi:hypothetical protein
VFTLIPSSDELQIGHYLPLVSHKKGRASHGLNRHGTTGEQNHAIFKKKTDIGQRLLQIAP